ncbi:MAG TPA: hypothetical protein DIT54_09450 [Lachnospiraceae bacterium]|nr:hypothetical protein [Lachnospiraceae bacterium]
MLYFIKNIKKLRQFIILLLLCCFCMAVIAVITAESMARLTEFFTISGVKGAGKNIFITIIFFLLNGVICYGYRLLCGHMEANVYRNIQQKSFYQLTHLKMDSPLLSNRGDLYSRINRDSAELTEFFATTLPTILMQSVQLVFIVIYILVVDWRITISYLVTLFLSLGLQGALSNYLKHASEKVKKAEVELNTRLKDTLENRLTVKTYDSYEFMEGLCQQVGEDYVHANMSLNLRSMPIKIIGILCGIAPILSLCLAGLFLVPLGFVKIGSFMTVYYLCDRILPQQLHYVDLFVNGVKIKVTAQRIRKLWEEPVIEQISGQEGRMKTKTGFWKADTANKDEKLIKRSLRDLGSLRQQEDIVLENVSYRYPDTKEWAVRELSLHIPKGKKVAFIGKSGCGKSTVIKLISGLLAPQEGTILVPENRLTGQFPNFFSGTIEENICCFTNRNEEEIKKACKNAGVYGFLSDLKDGLHTVLKDNGANLSGGQRQRIALARTLYSNAPVLLFDESVSALDAENAWTVIQNMIEEYSESTVIMVLHQPEFLPLMDEIYLFDEGEILAHGSYDQLVKENRLGGEFL